MLGFSDPTKFPRNLQNWLIHIAYRAVPQNLTRTLPHYRWNVESEDTRQEPWIINFGSIDDLFFLPTIFTCGVGRSTKGIQRGERELKPKS
jgi:hypothetical protein